MFLKFRVNYCIECFELYEMNIEFFDIFFWNLFDLIKGFGKVDNVFYFFGVE